MAGVEGEQLEVAEDDVLLWRLAGKVKVVPPLLRLRLVKRVVLLLLQSPSSGGVRQPGEAT